MLSPALASVLAHGGGVPEAALVGAPLLLFIAFLLLERRARRREAGEPPESEKPEKTG